MYKLQPDNWNGPAQCVHRLADNAFIPFDPANTCYQAYLKWISEGNTPLPPDEPAMQNEQPSS